MPWARVNGPCLALSLLKPIAEREGFQVDVLYLNLLWSEHLYHHHAAWLGKQRLEREDLEARERILLLQGGDNFYTGDWVFSQAYYGKGSLEADRYISEVLPERYTPDEIRYWLEIRDLVPAYVEECFRRVNLEDYSLVGFTSQFRQNLSSLLLARNMKTRRPDLKIVFGGSNCSGVMGEALLRAFPFVDFAVDGEAEFSFPALLGRLREGALPDGVPGIIFRNGEGVTRGGPPAVLENLDELPWPDFRDFQAQYEQSPLAELFGQGMVLELSRGCWWGMRHQCKFCGNHLHFLKYRSKTPGRAAAEILALAPRSASSQLSFSDTILGMPFLNGLMPRLAGSGLDLDMFFEVKSTLRKEHFRAMRRAGVRSVQPGIESFSTRLLRLMSKGVTALDNVQCLKWCEQYGITAYWNLLSGFPYEEAEDYEVILEYLRRISHLRPPDAFGPIRLDRFSPHFDAPEQYGFTSVRPMFVYPYIYDLPPRELADMAYAFQFSYADGRDPRTYTGKVREFVDRWSREPRGSLLHYVNPDGTGFLADSRFNRVHDRVELDPARSLVYKLCDRACSLSRLETLVRDAGFALSRRDLQGIVGDFVESLAMVSEGGRYLSVALRVTLGSRHDEVAEEEGDWLPILA